MMRKHFRLKRLVLGLAFAALAAAPVAQAKPIDFQVGFDQPIGSSVSLHGGVTPTLDQLQAEAARVSGSLRATQDELQANAAAWQSRLDSYQTQGSIHGGTTPTMQQLHAQALQYQQSQADKGLGSLGRTPGGPGGLVTTPHTTVAVASGSGSGGFDWTDAGIGGSAGLAAALLLSLSVMVARRYRSGGNGTLASA